MKDNISPLLANRCATIVEREPIRLEATPTAQLAQLDNIRHQGVLQGVAHVAQATTVLVVSMDVQLLVLVRLFP